MNKKTTEAFEDLEDARADQVRYHKLLRGLAAGVVFGVLVDVFAAILSSLYVADGIVAALAIPSSVFALACAVGFICRLVSAYESSYSTGPNHPAIKVRDAQRAYDKAVAEEAERG